MIEKITKNKDNLGVPDLEPIDKIVEKLDYYRSLFGKLEELTDDEYENLKQDISTFFTFKVGSDTKKPPERLIRISNNNRVLGGQGKELSYLTEISELLAPPIKYCNFGRCNIPNQQVLYCATTEAGAYWETKPEKGDVITISHYELKPDTEVNCFIVTKNKTEEPRTGTDFEKVYYILEDFFVDIYSLPISRDRPRDYLFSGLLTSDQLFYPVVADNNFEAILYPSVQRKKHGWNFAIRNELILERYNLIGVETRFILDEYENLNHESEEVTTDQIIGSFGTKAFDFEKGKILYNEEEADKLFKLFRRMQIGEGKQVRYKKDGVPENIVFNLTPKKYRTEKKIVVNGKFRRNDKVSVIYQNGTRIDNIKYKKIQSDVELGNCVITKY